MKTFATHIYRGILSIAIAGMAISTNNAATLYGPGENGYWVVETNAHTKDFSIVKFYNKTDEMVYEERLEGIHLDIRRKKNVKMLNRTLEKVTDNKLVSSQIKGYSNLVAENISKKQ